MNIPMLKLFNKPWSECVVTTIDFETTGLRPGIDRVVQAGLARFEKGVCVASVGSLIDGAPIPAEATAIHGITDEMVADAPTLTTFFEGEDVRALLENAQPAAFNAPFDRQFIPPWALPDYTWPWLDVLSLVRVVDRFERGKGRHKLTASCERHGIELTNAHSAEADAVAAGQLFYKLAHQMANAERGPGTLGKLLHWMQTQEANEWERFHSWLACQPPLQDEAQS